MNEPLTMSRPGISFSGKTHNKHPQWYNQPLRLNQEQRGNPLLILDEFFQCYHLNETRQLMWAWLTEVVSSSRSIISNDSHERENHMFFYEKMEELIEAAYMIKKRADKQRWKKAKSKFKKCSTVTG